MKLSYLPALLAATLLVFSGCCSTPGESVPAAPDYALSEAWHHVDRGGTADLFYISSTNVFDRPREGMDTCHFASVTDSLDRLALRHEMHGVDSLLSGDLNYYSPYYRQMTMESYLDGETVLSREPIPLSDVQAAFDYYWQHENRGRRPFILAGFSQGAQLAVGLLRSMPDSVYAHMVAAYVLGWHIGADDLSARALVPAAGAADTGVTVCYNSVKTPADANPVVSAENLVAINPVNWCTDATTAHFGDSLSAHLDPETRLLLVDGYTRSDHAFPPYFGGGNYHTFEIRWYAAYLRENMQQRLLHFEQHAADVVL